MRWASMLKAFHQKTRSLCKSGLLFDHRLFCGLYWDRLGSYLLKHSGNCGRYFSRSLSRCNLLDHRNSFALRDEFYHSISLDHLNASHNGT